MKKIAALLLSLAMIVSLSACEEKKEKTTSTSETIADSNETTVKETIQETTDNLYELNKTLKIDDNVSLLVSSNWNIVETEDTISVFFSDNSGLVIPKYDASDNYKYTESFLVELAENLKSDGDIIDYSFTTIADGNAITASKNNGTDYYFVVNGKMYMLLFNTDDTNVINSITNSITVGEQYSDNTIILDKECLFNNISFKFSSEWVQTLDNDTCTFLKDKNLFTIQMNDKTVDDETEFEVFFESYLKSTTVTDVLNYDYMYIDEKKAAYVDWISDNGTTKSILLICGNKKYTFMISLANNKTESEFAKCYEDLIASIELNNEEIETSLKNNDTALKNANKYLEYNGMSSGDLYAQLITDGYTIEQIDYAIANCYADWNQEAADKAKYYIEISDLSRQELYDYLIEDGFTEEQAEYGVTAVGY